MRIIAAAVAVTSVSLATAMMLSMGLPSVQAEQQAGSHDRSAQPIILGTPPPISGFLFVVTSTGDGDNTGSGAVCDDGTGNCTLRAAIEAANNNAGDDGIHFSIPTSDPGYNAQTGMWTITLPRALPDISSNIAIQGPGAGKLTISGNNAVRVFNVTAPPGGNVSFSDLAISNGNAAGAAGVFSGTGSDVTITNCIVRDNVTANGGTGGGIYQGTGSGGTMIVSNSTVSRNTAGGGGGIESVSGDGTLMITNSTIDGNSAVFPMVGSGGGIYIGSGTVVISNSTLSNNNAVGPGGGIDNTGGNLTISNSTLAGNQSTNGGGIHNGAALTLTYSTISANTITGAVGSGGGILSSGGSAAVSVKSSIIASNAAPGSNPPDVNGSFTSGGFNLISRIDGSTGFNQPTDHIGTIASPLDPKLALLANNGGLTQTMALQSGSVAINNGATDAPSRDQRGYIRNGAPDIGAFEFGGTIPVSLGNISTRGMVGTGDNVMIGGFIVAGPGNKSVLLRAIGPSLANPPFNLPNTLQDPTLSLFNSTGAMIAFNDNWAQASNAQSIPSNLQPTNGSESAILTFLAPGAYTAIVRGVNGGTGIGLVEAFDLDATVPSKLSNISTRGLVEIGDGVMIGGFIVNGSDSDKVVVRAIGPSLASPPFNLTNVLQNPTLSLFDANGMMFASNDDWRSTQEAAIIATGLQPTNDAESAIVTTLTPGNYTAIVRGAGGSTGVGLVEVYGLN
jgi:CSLREA domain-containing protein